MVSEPDTIQVLLQDIRRCRDCIVDCPSTPVVYSAPNPKIVVVSEEPPLGAWRKDLGKSWAGDGEKKGTIKTEGWQGGTAHQFCEWAGITDGIDQLVFWIQRANCRVNTGRGYVFHHCSYKFILRAIQVVRPKLVITLGHVAAQFFLQFNNLSEVVGDAYRCKEGAIEYTLIPLFHPSKTNQPWRTQFKQIHEDSKRALEVSIDEVKRIEA